MLLMAAIGLTTGGRLVRILTAVIDRSILMINTVEALGLNTNTRIENPGRLIPPVPNPRKGRRQKHPSILGATRTRAMSRHVGSLMHHLEGPSATLHLLHPRSLTTIHLHSAPRVRGRSGYRHSTAMSSTPVKTSPGHIVPSIVDENQRCPRTGQNI